MAVTNYLINPDLERKHKRISATITTILMILLLLLALFIALNQPEDDFPQEGILISFGTPEPGSGMVEPMPQEVQQKVTTPPPTPVTETEQPVEPVPSEVNTVAVDVKKEEKKTEPVKKPEPKPEQPKQEQPKEEKFNPKYTYSSSGKSDKSTSTSQGDNIGMGNEGDPKGGEKIGKSDIGDGSVILGQGLGGRGWAIQPDKDVIQHNLPQQTNFVLDIEVYPDGRIKVLGINRSSQDNTPQIKASIERALQNARIQSGNETVRTTVTFVLKPR